MYIEKLNLINFKNYLEIDLSFSPQINIFTGSNGSGKTNLVDAIFCLSLTKSAFSALETNSIRHSSNFFSILGHFHKEEKRFAVQYDLTPQKKSFQVNKTPYQKLSEHIGAFPVVLITPNDTDVIREGGEGRRKFFDSIISQLDNVYLLTLINYNATLKQRNSLLKSFAEKKTYDADLLEGYTWQLQKLGRVIYEKRKSFVEEFIPLFLGHYSTITEEKERPSIRYLSQLHDEGFEQKVRTSLDRDLATQRTTMGIHKDDYEFLLDTFLVKNYGSQGQQKSFVIALKLAHFDSIKIRRGLKPILLLDDIFDKLDDFRIRKLMEMVAEDSFGQLFITDARPERTQKIFEGINAEIRIFHIEQGAINDLIAKPNEKRFLQ